MAKTKSNALQSLWVCVRVCFLWSGLRLAAAARPATPAPNQAPIQTPCVFSLPSHRVLPVAWRLVYTFVEIKQCQLCNTKATMPSLCLTAKVQGQPRGGSGVEVLWQVRLLLLALLCSAVVGYFVFFHFFICAIQK